MGSRLAGRPTRAIGRSDDFTFKPDSDKLTPAISKTSDAVARRAGRNPLPVRRSKKGRCQTARDQESEAKAEQGRLFQCAAKNSPPCAAAKNGERDERIYPGNGWARGI